MFGTRLNLSTKPTLIFTSLLSLVFMYHDQVARDWEAPGFRVKGLEKGMGGFNKFETPMKYCGIAYLFFTLHLVQESFNISQLFPRLLPQEQVPLINNFGQEMDRLSALEIQLGKELWVSHT